MITYSILCRTERGRDGNLREERPAALFVDKVEDGLGGVDGRAAADGDDDVRARLLELLQAGADARDGRVLADLVERRAIRVAFAEDVLDRLHDVRLRARVVSIVRTERWKGTRRTL